MANCCSANLKLWVMLQSIAWKFSSSKWHIVRWMGFLNSACSLTAEPRPLSCLDKLSDWLPVLLSWAAGLPLIQVPVSELYGKETDDFWSRAKTISSVYIDDTLGCAFLTLGCAFLLTEAVALLLRSEQFHLNLNIWYLCSFLSVFLLSLCPVMAAIQLWSLSAIISSVFDCLCC